MIKPQEINEDGLPVFNLEAKGKGTATEFETEDGLPILKKKESFDTNPHSYLNLFGKKLGPSGNISSPTQLQSQEETNNLPSTSTVKLGATDARVSGYDTNAERIASPKALGKALTMGAASGISGTLKAIGIAAKELDLFNEYKGHKAEELATYRAGKWIDEAVKDLVGELSPEEQKNFSVKLAQGVGQMGTMMAGGLGARALGASTTLTTATMGAAMGASSEWENAIAAGATPEQASKVFWINGVINSTDALPMMRVFRNLDKYSGGMATGVLAKKLASTVGGRITSDVFQGAVTEATQEAVQQILTNVTAKNTYDATRSIWDGVAESGAIGGIIGTAMNGVISTIREKRAAGNLTPEEDADLAKAEKFATEKLKEQSKIASHVNHVNKVKENISHLPEKNQDAFVEQSLAEKMATEKAESSADPTIIKKAKDVAKEAHEIKEQLLQGKDPDEIVTESQQKKIDEQNDAKDKIEFLTKQHEIDLEKWEAKRKGVDGREGDESKAKIKELNLEKEQIIKEHEKKVAEQEAKLPKEEKVTPSEKVTPTDDITKATEAAKTDIKDEVYRNAFTENPEQSLKELAQQLNSSEVEANATRRMFGDTISDIALKLYPKEKVGGAEKDISVGDMIGKTGNYKGEKGSFYQDGQTVVFKVDGKNKEYELGNVEEIKDTPISDFDIVHEKSVVDISDSGDIKVRGQEYKNNYSNPLAAINHDADGNVVSVNLETADGSKRTFRGNIAEDIAYQIHLKEINKNNETRSEFEKFINTDESAKQELDNGRLSETTKTEPTETPKKVSREKIQSKPKSTVEKPKQNQGEKPERSVATEDAQGTTADKTKKETEVGKPPTEPPIAEPPKSTGGGGMDGLDKLANNIPDSGKVAEYMSKETIEKYTGETPQNDQTRGVQELDIALHHGEKIIEEAKRVFGEDYVDKTLDYIENSKAGISNKALMYVSLENALGREKEAVRDDAQKVRDITKQQALVYEQSQKFARENSLALNYQKLRKIAQVGYDIEKVTDHFFSAEEIEAKGEIKKAVEADGDAINEEAQKQETAGMTPDVEKAIAEGIEKEVNKIYEALPKEKRSKIDRMIRAIEEVQKKLRSRTYDATLGIPVAIVDAGFTTIKHALKVTATVAEAVEAGIKKMKELLAKDKDWKDKKWEGEERFRKDALAEFEKFAPDVKKIVKESLIKAGFGRTVNVKGEEKQMLDWKKLAGRAGTVSKISENVAEVFKKEGKSAEEINAIKDDLVNEYINLRASVIEKAQNEIARRNKETVTPEQKSAAKKLSELYTYGLFEQKLDEFDVAVNKALGAKVSEKGFQEAKELARAMEMIYANSFKGIRLNDISAKAALERLEDRMRVLLFREAKKQGNTNLRLANFVRNYFEIQQTMLLNNMKQAVENPFSGLQQKIIENLNSLSTGSTTKELSKQNRKLMADVYKDMVLKGGMGYGKVESQFVNRQHIDDYVNKLSDNELYHGIASVVTGKATLNAMDAMYKAGITEKKFTHNLITILTHDTNPNKMSKKDALKYVSEHLTGQSFKDAQKTSIQIIEQINKDAGKELIPTNTEMVDRFANDIVKASLEMGGKITPEQIKAAYGAAYKGAGLGLGHEANNILSSQLKGYGARIEGEINNAIKNKEWNRAAALTMKGVLYRNILNPFVGGGTNWLMLKLEKTGLGLFTGLAYKIGSKQDIDLSTKTGLARLETRLYNQGRWKDNMMRGLIGGAVTWGSYGLALALMNTDDYREWRKKNRWAARYLDIITPEPMLTRMALKEGKLSAVKQYIGQSYNRNDAFSAEEKFVKGLGKFAEGKPDQGWGAWGEMVGGKANAPLPWRLFKDGQVLYQGIKGQDPYHGDYKPSSGFANGFFQGGVIEWLGARPKPQIEPKSDTFKIYSDEKVRDATPEEYKKYTETRDRINGEMLKQYEQEGVMLDKYGEITLNPDEEEKTIKYKDLSKEQIKDLTTKISSSSDDKAKLELGFLTKQQAKSE